MQHTAPRVPLRPVLIRQREQVESDFRAGAGYRESSADRYPWTATNPAGEPIDHHLPAVMRAISQYPPAESYVN